MTIAGDGDAREQATRWWGRMHGPDAAAQRDAFERWRSADPRHAAEYAMLERTWSLAAGLGSTEIGRARTLRRQRPLAWATAPRLALAAAAMVALALMIVLRPAGAPGTSVVAEAHATAVGEIRTLKLPDGSSVTLDTNSRVEVAFDDRVRKIRLERGRARFDVRQDASRAFLVEAGGKAVTAADSRFDVRVAPDGLCLIALRGAVEVRPAATAGGSTAPFRIGPGKAMRFAASGVPLTVDAPPTTGSEQWVSGMLVFQSTPLSAVIEETNRYSRRRIVLAEPSLGTLKVTGTFRPLPVEQLAASLAAAFNLEVRPDPNGNLILARRAGE